MMFNQSLAYINNYSELQFTQEYIINRWLPSGYQSNVQCTITSYIWYSRPIDKAYRLLSLWFESDPSYILQLQLQLLRITISCQ